jgi:hypothetical protein
MSPILWPSCGAWPVAQGRLVKEGTLKSGLGQPELLKEALLQQYLVLLEKQQYLVLLENQRLSRLQCKPLCQWSMKCETWKVTAVLAGAVSRKKGRERIDGG